MVQEFYSPNDRMIRLIADNYSLIHVMTRFGIRMGFGDKSVKEVCDENEVDCQTFLAVVNFVVEGYIEAEYIDNISVDSILHYLRQSHVYFLEYCLPAIRRKLLDGIRLQTSDISFLILRCFDEYTNEVRTHMEFEEKMVFTYVAKLIKGEALPNFKIDTYSDHHEQVANRLKELKLIIIRYCPDSADVNLLNDALYDIYRCEQELESHCRVEDQIFVPVIRRMETKLAVDKGKEAMHE